MLSKRLSREGSSWDLSSLAKDCRVRSGSPVWQAGSPKMPTRCEELNDPTKVRGCSFLSRGVPRTWGSGFIIFRFSADVQPVFVFGRVFWMALYWGWSMISPSLSQNAMVFFFLRWPPAARKKKQRPFRSFLLGADRTSYQMLCFSQVFRSTVLPRPCRQNWIGWYQLADKLLFLQPQRYQCWVIHKDAWQRKTRIWWGLYTFRVWWPKKSEGCSKFIAGTWTKHGTPLNLWDYLGASCIKTQEKQWKIRVSIVKVTNLVPLNWLHTCDFSQFYVPWSHQGWTANTLESTGGKFCRSGKLSGSFCGTT